MLRIAKYGTTRHWALYEGETLVVVTVYKKGAEAVRQRLAGQPPSPAAAQPALAAQARALARQAQKLARQARG